MSGPDQAGSLDDCALPPGVRRQAKRLLTQIETADSMIQTVKCGARAEGFVLGIAAVGGVEQEEIERLEAVFGHATERQLLALASIEQK
jgi:hypothetical protein